MKKLITVLSVLITTIVLVGCGAKSQPATPTPDPTSVVVPAPVPATPETPHEQPEQPAPTVPQPAPEDPQPSPAPAPAPIRGNSEYQGELVNQTDNIIAFDCIKSYGDTEDIGGSGATKYKCVLINSSEIHVFYTLLSTTGDNGYTTESVANINDFDGKELVKYVGENNWEILWNYCDSIHNSCEQVVLTKGMNDDESRNEDGSYKWESYYNQLAELE